MPPDLVGESGTMWTLTAEQRSVALSIWKAPRPGGAPLTERALAEHAGVSRETVRSCLRRLREAGLVAEGDLAPKAPGRTAPLDTPPPAPAPAPLLIATEPVRRPPKVPPRKPNSPLSFFLAQNVPELPDPVGFEETLRKGFPGVDVLSEVRKAWTWNRAQRTQSQKKDLRRFFVNWCGRARPSATAAAPTRGVIVDLDPEGNPVYEGEGT